MSSIQARRRVLRAAAEFSAVWWPEMGIATGLITAGAIWWWPLGLIALWPASVPAREAALQIVHLRRLAERRAAIEAERAAEQPSAIVQAQALRLNVPGPAAIEAGGEDQ
jgi:hypothetical protein